jgi:hypothetical protein
MYLIMTVSDAAIVESLQNGREQVVGCGDVSSSQAQHRPGAQEYKPVTHPLTVLWSIHKSQISLLAFSFGNRPIAIKL